MLAYSSAYLVISMRIRVESDRIRFRYSVKSSGKHLQSERIYGIWYSSTYNEKGEKQLCEYLERFGLKNY